LLNLRFTRSQAQHSDLGIDPLAFAGVLAVLQDVSKEEG
jgi:hypothetical protein